MRLLSPAHVAQRLGIKPQSLRLRRMKGQGPPFVRLSDSPTARAFYPEDAFNAWLEARPLRMGTAEEKRDTKTARTPSPPCDVDACGPIVSTSGAEAGHSAAPS
jgi:hypothetical protein